MSKYRKYITTAGIAITKYQLMPVSQIIKAIGNNPWTVRLNPAARLGLR